MRYLNALLLFVFVSVTVVSCSGPVKEKAKTKDSVPVVDTSFLADKNYPFKNVKNTLPIFKNIKYYKEVMYADSTHNTAFVELTKSQKLKLVVPFISKELKVDEKYVVDMMQAYFVARQAKVGDLQPIILYITGDDYTSLTMILINKAGLPAGGFNVNGGFQGGPEQVGDSITKYELRSYSYLKGNQITTIKIEQSDYADTLKRLSVIDSTVFKSIIANDGKITTKQTLKNHHNFYNRP
jgi:hypothetical protein